MFKFEKVSRFEGVDIAAPIRKTEINKFKQVKKKKQ